MSKPSALLIAAALALLAGCTVPGAPEQPTEVPAPTDTDLPPAETDAAPSSTPRPTSTPVPSATPSPAAATPADWGSATAAVLAVQAAASQQTGLAPNQLVITRVEAQEWRDSSLGCPKPGFAYLQVITPGWLIMVEAGGNTYEYHTNANGSAVVLCNTTTS